MTEIKDEQNSTLSEITGYSKLDDTERTMLYAIINLIIAMFYNHKKW